MTIPIDTTVPDDDAPQVEWVDATDVGLADAETTDVVEPEAVMPDRADAPVSEITERFLKVVLAHVPLDRIEELHLFSPLRQGGVETGIAVIAARVPLVVVESPAAPELPFQDDIGEVAEVTEVVTDELVAEEEIVADADDVAVPRLRHTVYTARYRLVQKGPERGKWEADVVAEAEAPLITVDLVVRGVQRRAGEESEIVRYSAPQLAHAVRVPYPAV